VQHNAGMTQDAPVARRFSARVWLFGLFLIAALIAGGISAYAALNRSGALMGLPGLERFPEQKREHVEGKVVYATNPPVGGSHAKVWQNCGVYDVPIPNETATHSLEHGSVWIAYRPDLAAKDQAKLKKLVLKRQYALLSPYPGLETPVAAVAWGVRLKLARVDVKLLERFLEVFSPNKAAPEWGSYCVGGTGIPIYE
jgi:hypothetical protein